MAPLTFADTHNMIAFLTKSDTSEGFDQIVYFLNAHTIQYALMVNPPIYVSCIKQFWASVLIKKSNDTVKLQALIDRKKIFVELARMGYEKPSTKLTFYKAFFSAQWKFLIHTIFQCMIAKKTAWNEFSSFMASAIICLTTIMINAQVDDLSSHNTKYTSSALTQKVFANMRRIGKGFSGVETPLFDNMLVQQQVQDDVGVEVDEDDNEVPTAPSPPKPATTSPPQQETIPSPTQAQYAQPSSPHQQQPSQTADILESSMTLLNTLMETRATLTQKVANLEQDKIAQALEITKLKQRVKKLEKKRGFKSRMHPNRGEITELDADEDVTLVDVNAEIEIDTNIQGRMVES
uniref:Synaptobrevin, longin-like domain protein n=1 Tax=Tanacetum cinerariifolium TaxID=118510 RepID=A0A699HSG9_TANCI|nr:hypothetical protein [Tanacetum cinerariifolium]